MAKTEEEVVQPDVIEQTALATISKAEIDVQISTAHQYPRSMQIFKRRAMEMVTLDQETAQACIYRRPIGKEGGRMKYAEGKSVRMAEIVGACYGNLRVGAQLIEQTPRQVRARGFAHDLESNFAASSEVIESLVDKKGNPYSERMAVVVAKAALAKARRDATFQVVPGALCKALEDAARKTAIGSTKTLGARRDGIMDWINKLGIEPARVWAALGVKGIDDVGLDEIVTLTGIRTAMNDKEATVDEAFPKLGAGKDGMPPMPQATDKEKVPPAGAAPPDDPPADAEEVNNLWDQAVDLGLKLKRSQEVAEKKANEAMKSDGKAGLVSLIQSLEELVKASGKE